MPVKRVQPRSAAGKLTDRSSSRARWRSYALAPLLALAAFALTAAPALAAAPGVVSESVPSVTPFEARLEATVKAAENPNPAEEPTECHFEYGKTSVSEHKVECEQGNALEGGEQGVSLNVTGLEPGKTYHYRVVVKNTTGEEAGVSEEFTTLTAEAPFLESENASAVTATEATLEAAINPNYQKTAYKFEYATNKALTGAKTATGATELEGFGGQTGSVAVSGLAPGEIYYYRVVAKNPTGTTIDPVVRSFATVPAPVTSIPLPTSGTSARFEGHFTLAFVTTQWFFDYKLVANGAGCTGESSTPTIEAGSGESEAVEAWEVPSGENPGVYGAVPPLYPNKEYTVCFVTSNVYGSQVGSPESFTTPPAAPAINSASVSGVGRVGATLDATINPENQETKYTFEYSEKENGSGVLEAPIVKVPSAPGTIATAFEEHVVEAPTGVLKPATTYYYRVVAENESGTTEYPVQPFTTFNLPALTPTEASSITQTTATFSGGTVNPAGAETKYHVAYVEAAAYEEAAVTGNPYERGKSTPEASAGSSYEPQGVAKVEVTELRPGTPYDYALVAVNSVGRTVGPKHTFTTAAAPPPPPPHEAEKEVPTTGSTTPSSLPAVIPFTTIAEAQAKEAKENKGIPTPTGTKPLTKAQKLQKALKSCHKDKQKSKRQKCEKQARNTYGPTKKGSK